MSESDTDKTILSGLDKWCDSAVRPGKHGIRTPYESGYNDALLDIKVAIRKILNNEQQNTDSKETGGKGP